MTPTSSYQVPGEQARAAPARGVFTGLEVFRRDIRRPLPPRAIARDSAAQAWPSKHVGFDEEADDFAYGNSVSQCDGRVQRGFLRKVFGLVATQLTITAIMSGIAMFVPAVRLFVLSSPCALPPRPPIPRTRPPHPSVRPGPQTPRNYPSSQLDALHHFHRRPRHTLRMRGLQGQPPDESLLAPRVHALHVLVNRNRLRAVLRARARHHRA